MCSDCLRDVPALAGRRIKKQAIRIVAICPLLCCIDQATLCLGSHGQYGAAVTLEIWFDSQGTQHCLPPTDCILPQFAAYPEPEKGD